MNLLLLVDLCITAAFYIYLLRGKKRIGFQLGMNISTVMGGVGALLVGSLLILQFPFHYTFVTIISTLAGAAMGALFGLLFDYQTFITGLVNGIIAGIMAPMIATAAEMPDLFIVFSHLLFAVSLLLILISIKRS